MKRVINHRYGCASPRLRKVVLHQDLMILSEERGGGGWGGGVATAPNLTIPYQFTRSDRLFWNATSREAVSK